MTDNQKLWTVLIGGQVLFLYMGLGWMWPVLIGYFYIQAKREQNAR